jgi:hypothetical protein
MNKSRYIWLIYIASLLSLSACTVTYPNIPPNYHLNYHNGVILLSLTAFGECGYAYFIDIRDIEHKHDYTIGMQDAGEERDWRKKTFDCPSKPEEYFGRLVAIELPVGIYQIYQFEGVSTSRHITSEHELHIDFSVKPGVVNYLGNAQFNVMKKMFILNIKDEHKRDIPLFQKKYQQFRSKDIINNLIRIKGSRLVPA